MLARFGVDGNYNGKGHEWSCYGRLSKHLSLTSTAPDDIGRYSFWLQTGISPDAQVELENYFDQAVWGDDKRQFISNLETLLK